MVVSLLHPESEPLVVWMDDPRTNVDPEVTSSLGAPIQPRPPPERPLAVQGLTETPQQLWSPNVDSADSPPVVQLGKGDGNGLRCSRGP